MKKKNYMCGVYKSKSYMRTYVLCLSRSALSTHPFGLLLKNVIHNRSELRMEAVISGDKKKKKKKRKKNTVRRMNG